ncbi:hypothetical protein PG993_006354 [Apiospora rasikravindrae]|uniref:Uncharacterized protein n=1 Tax=Apiospora rasikravindrae TaxID=990691 RepID=A0ABR1T5G8_9PEZI
MEKLLAQAQGFRVVENEIRALLDVPVLVLPFTAPVQQAAEVVELFDGVQQDFVDPFAVDGLLGLQELRAEHRRMIKVFGYLLQQLDECLSVGRRIYGYPDELVELPDGL